MCRFMGGVPGVVVRGVAEVSSLMRRERPVPLSSRIVVGYEAVVNRWLTTGCFRG